MGGFCDKCGNGICCRRNEDEGECDGFPRLENVAKGVWKKISGPIFGDDNSGVWNSGRIGNCDGKIGGCHRHECVAYQKSYKEKVEESIKIKVGKSWERTAAHEKALNEMCMKDMPAEVHLDLLAYAEKVKNGDVEFYKEDKGWLGMGTNFRDVGKNMINIGSMIPGGGMAMKGMKMGTKMALPGSMGRNMLNEEEPVIDEKAPKGLPGLPGEASQGAEKIQIENGAAKVKEEPSSLETESCCGDSKQDANLHSLPQEATDFSNMHVKRMKAGTDICEAHKRFGNPKRVPSSFNCCGFHPGKELAVGGIFSSDKTYQESHPRCSFPHDIGMHEIEACLSHKPKVSLFVQCADRYMAESGNGQISFADSMTARLYPGLSIFQYAGFPKFVIKTLANAELTMEAGYDEEKVTQTVMEEEARAHFEHQQEQKGELQTVAPPPEHVEEQQDQVIERSVIRMPGVSAATSASAAAASFFSATNSTTHTSSPESLAKTDLEAFDNTGGLAAAQEPELGVVSPTSSSPPNNQKQGQSGQEVAKRIAASSFPASHQEQGQNRQELLKPPDEQGERNRMDKQPWSLLELTQRLKRDLGKLKDFTKEVHQSVRSRTSLNFHETWGKMEFKELLLNDHDKDDTTNTAALGDPVFSPVKNNSSSSTSGASSSFVENKEEDKKIKVATAATDHAVASQASRASTVSKELQTSEKTKNKVGTTTKKVSLLTEAVGLQPKLPYILAFAKEFQYKGNVEHAKADLAIMDHCWREDDMLTRKYLENFRQFYYSKLLKPEAGGGKEQAAADAAVGASTTPTSSPDGIIVPPTAAEQAGLTPEQQQQQVQQQSSGLLSLQEIYNTYVNELAKTDTFSVPSAIGTTDKTTIDQKMMSISAQIEEEKPPEDKGSLSTGWLVFVIVLIVLLVAGLGLAVVYSLMPELFGLENAGTANYEDYNTGWDHEGASAGQYNFYWDEESGTWVETGQQWEQSYDQEYGMAAFGASYDDMKGGTIMSKKGRKLGTKKGEGKTTSKDFNFYSGKPGKKGKGKQGKFSGGKQDDGGRVPSPDPPDDSSPFEEMCAQQ
ncbi:unnamed protein product [Amoebophrya sp. A120]|nr:unnamed protein product [Amoebophrya sp. A120]|eukprot:GSA120T00014186001.1